MARRLRLVLLLALAVAGLAQRDRDNADDSQDEFNDRKKLRKPIQATCLPYPTMSGRNGQTYSIECAVSVPPGRAGLASFRWESDLSRRTRIRRTRLLVSPVNGTLGEGEERITLLATFTRDGQPQPTCATRRRILLTFNSTRVVELEPKLAPAPGEGDHDGDGDGGHDGEGDHDHDGGHDHGEDDEEYHKGDKDGKDREEEDDDDQEKRLTAQGTAGPEVQFDEWNEPGDIAEAEDGEFEAQSWGDKTRWCPTRGMRPASWANVDAIDTRHVLISDTNEPDEKASLMFQSLPAQAQKPKRMTPGGLRVLVKCKSAPNRDPADGDCVVLLRLRVVFTGGFQATPRMNVFETAATQLVDTDDYTCRAVRYTDLLGVTGDGAGTLVRTQLCYPPPPGGIGRKLAQAAAPAAAPAQAAPAQAAPAQSGAPTIPSGATWDDTTFARAVRASRYASTLHGCLPGQTTPSGATRTWPMVASWGGPTLNGNCQSCFKDGINYGPGLGGGPVGWETPEFGLIPPSLPSSFRDAAVVLTDTAIDGPGNPAVVVVFRATVTAIQASQWISNVGSCMLVQDRIDAAPGTPAAGQICDGWRSPIDTLNQGFQGFNFLGIPRGTLNGPAIGLMDEVKRRVGALRPNQASQASPTRIFVIGHSRGGALAASFTAQLLAEQAAGRLFAFSRGNVRQQVSLYTMGAPRVGDATFAQWLEERMFERFRLTNRYDPVPTGPLESQGYRHWRPSVWFRDSSGNTLPSPTNYCVMTPQAQLRPAQRDCFISCNDALVCSFGVGVNVPGSAAGRRVPNQESCQDIVESSPRALALGLGGSLPGKAFVDHATYVGIDEDNEQCRVDQSVYALGCIECQPDGRGDCPAPGGK